MKAAKQILQKLGTSVEEMEYLEYHVIEVSEDKDLTIIKRGDARITVAHYQHPPGEKERCHPEIMFKIDDGEWVPILYTLDPGIHKHDETGLSSLKEFVELWSQQLKAQGFIEAAENTTT